MSLLTKIGELYEEMWKAIIRPPRDFYTIDQLGPSEFFLQNKRFKRRDFELLNKRGLKIQCSHFEPVRRDGSYDSTPRPCVIYMHGNCSSRLEAVHCGCLRILLPIEVSVVCFDFTGSGLSEGDYVSLGWYEHQDLEEVIAHLRTRETVSTIGLWGRSMGAVTACLLADKDPSIAGLVIDSPFSSLRRLAEEVAGDVVGVRMPKFIVSMGLNIVRNTVQQKAHFDFDKLELTKHCKLSFIPALFVAAKEDSFIRPHHARDLHDVYAGDKNFILVDGTHNTARPKFLHDSIGIFFKFALQLHGDVLNPVWEGVALEMASQEQQRRHECLQHCERDSAESQSCSTGRPRRSSKPDARRDSSDARRDSSDARRDSSDHNSDVSNEVSPAAWFSMLYPMAPIDQHDPLYAELIHQQALFQSLENNALERNCDDDVLDVSGQALSDSVDRLPMKNVEEFLEEFFSGEKNPTQNRDDSSSNSSQPDPTAAQTKFPKFNQVAPHRVTEQNKEFVPLVVASGSSHNAEPQKDDKEQSIFL